MNKLDSFWDVIVIGGGPAGMMAAGRAAELGSKVLLLEKNNTLGEKLLITGGGRCNVTNAEPDLRKLLSKFKDANQFLFSTFSQFTNANTIYFFNSRNVSTKVEAEQRVFPISDSAGSIWDVMVDYLKKNKVEIYNNSEITDFLTDDNKILGIKLKGGKELKASNFILATGGMSRPETGSTGDGFKWLKGLGHEVKEPKASLVPIKIEDQWVKKLSGKSLVGIKITIFQNGIKQVTKVGKILFTHFGVSGPTILNLSNEVSELLKYGEVFISLDLLPTLDFSSLNDALQELFKKEDKKKIKNALSSLITPGLVPIILSKINLNPDKECNSITRSERILLMKALKDIQMKAIGILGEDKAIITSGGVILTEIDFKTMQSKLFPNLYIVGDLLDIDRPSGGYSLQLCWTTGFVAGTHAS